MARVNKAGKSATTSKSGKKASEKSSVVLLSGGNPQIAKGDGDAALEGWDP